jgi:hypothetical protein
MGILFCIGLVCLNESYALWFDSEGCGFAEEMWVVVWFKGVMVKWRLRECWLLRMLMNKMGELCYECVVVVLRGEFMSVWQRFSKEKK